MPMLTLRHRSMLLAFLAISAFSAIGDTIDVRQVSVGMASDTGNGETDSYIVSGDDRWVALISSATNLIESGVDNNQTQDIFLFDRESEQTTLVSHVPGHSTWAANGESLVIDMSDDGRWILFESAATNLVPAQSDLNDAKDVFLFDRISGEVRLLSRTASSAFSTADGYSVAGELSGDGRFALFESSATNVMAGVTDTNGVSDAFLYDVPSDVTTLISHRAGAPLVAAASTVYFVDAKISRNGEWIGYSSSAGDVLDPNGQSDGSSRTDVYLVNRASGATTKITHAAGQPLLPTDGSSYVSAISNDGSVMLLHSYATNLVPNQIDVGYDADLFAYARADGSMRLVSHAASSPAATANNVTYASQLSEDGNTIAFHSKATDLIAGVSDTNTTWDSFVFDRVTGITKLVSRSAASATVTADRTTRVTAMSDDGRYLLLSSTAGDLVAGVVEAATFGSWDVFLFDRLTQAMSLVSHVSTSNLTTASGQSYAGDIASDGSFAVFSSDARGIDAAISDTSLRLDTFVFDKASSSSQAISRKRMPGIVAADGNSTFERTSADGEFSLMESTANDLAPNQTPEKGDRELFLVQRSTGTITQIASLVPSYSSGWPFNFISADGRWIAFTSQAADVIPGLVGQPWGWSVFLYDRLNATTRLISRHHANANWRDHGEVASISADGRWIAYSSGSNDIVPGMTADNAIDVFLYDRGTDTSSYVSRPAFPSDPNQIQDSYHALVSDDGAFVAFRSWASDLIPGLTDNNNCEDVYRYHRISNTMQLVSHRVGYTQATANGCSELQSISADGNLVLFSSQANNIAPGIFDNGYMFDMFVFDGNSGSRELISRSSAQSNQVANNNSQYGVISKGGRWVAYTSTATDIVAGVIDVGFETPDLMLFDRFTGRSRILSVATDGQTAQGAHGLQMTPDGRHIAFHSRGTAFVEPGNDSNDYSDVFLFDRCAGKTSLVSPRVGFPGQTANSYSFMYAMSDDGLVLGMNSGATDLVSNVLESEATTDAFTVTRVTDQIFVDGLDFEACQ